MKTDSSNQTTNNNSPAKMAFDMYPSISSGKQQDPVREVVMKYIDYFLTDASGTSAVAIDNKIEQAMDLVKSHLMIAVREEVEVLKEKISELMEKITQLEVENTILKANMPQETLQKLQMQLTGTAPTATNMIGAAPTQAPPAAATVVAANVNALGGGGGNNQQQQQQQQIGQITAAAAVTNTGSGTATPTTQTAVETVGDHQNVINPADESQQQQQQPANGPMS